MTHKFCIDCGAKNIFLINPPDFCCSCGTSFNEVKKNTKKSKAKAKQRIEEEEDDDDDDSESLLNLDKEALKKDWSIVGQGSRFETVGEAIFNNPNFGAAVEVQRRIPRPESFTDDVVQRSLKECARVTSSKSIE